MNLYYRILTFAVLLFFSVFTVAQNIGVGQWRDQLPYKKSIDVVEAGEIIYCATPYSLFYYNKTDESVQRLTKVNGLSDVGINAINYSSDHKTLVIAYSNTNIDLIKGNVIINIPDIKRKTILGNKTISKILFIDKYAYLSCGFGIVVLDVENEEIHDTYYIGPEGSKINILDLTFNDTAFFAATESGIYYASLTNPNLANFSSWTKDNSVLTLNKNFNAIQAFNGRVFANISNPDIYNSDILLFYNGTDWEVFNPAETYTKREISVNYNQMIISCSDNVQVFDLDFNLNYLINSVNSTYPIPYDAIIDKDNYVWIADKRLSLIKTWDKGHGAESIELNGPGSVNVFQLASGGKDIWVAPGGRSNSWASMSLNNGLFHFNGDDWTTYNSSNITAFDTIIDFVCIAIYPGNPQRVFSGGWGTPNSFGTGVIELLNGEINEIYTPQNSAVQPLDGYSFNRTSAVCFDNNNNLWIANSGANLLLTVKTYEGDWKALDLGTNARSFDLGKMIIDSYNQKWIIKRVTDANSQYLVVFNDNNTILDTSDDETKLLGKQENRGNIPGSKVYSMAVDLDGEVWIGTDEGICVFYSPENIFESSTINAQRILVEQDGYVQYLLETEIVTAITINGANQKWMGTQKAGVFLLSEDGTEEIHHFTEDNSPLLSNDIIDIAINSDGEVFFGTTKGIISFKGYATPGGPTNNDVYAYPNPVREDFSGVIAIRGLVKNANVKITDISGTLIYSTQAEGGQAIWDGKNFDGRRAHTGVYMVFSSNDDGSETLVTKILFIN
ncbi:MAG: T9SS type A sorting domain-containing protein [Bacteroidales bacterium]|nr:T9SS type A sorting domain-containing protein [Bacteroidales bacterium]